MLVSLGVTALLMGVVGGPHCVAMCGAACAGMGRAAGAHQGRAILSFQSGRLLGYTLLGALAGASMQGLGWLTLQSAALRPVWSLLHVAAAVLGLVLLVEARQPVWLEAAGRSVWARVRGSGLAASAGMGPCATAGTLGILWALLPCGLLYSALLVATLAGSAAGGAGVMAAFALGSGVSMTLGSLFWLKLLPQRGASAALQGQWGVRVAGALLTTSAVVALWLAYAHDAAPWCAVPAAS